MKIDHHLTDQLKTLKLSGILLTLETRLSQAQKGDLGFLEFLNLLFQDEIERRTATALARRIRLACFEQDKTMEGFDFGAVPKLNRPLIHDLAASTYIERGDSVILCGPTGVGKTHLAQALGHAACRQGYKVYFVKMNKMFRALYAARADQSWNKAIRKYLSPDLLIIDDFGLQSFTKTQAEDLYEIVTERNLKSSTIVTSNRPIQDWPGLFPDPVMAQAVVDRIRHQAHIVVIAGDSYRSSLNPGPTKGSAAASG
jgi:DNA replication protein DnaC